ERRRAGRRAGQTGGTGRWANSRIVGAISPPWPRTAAVRVSRSSRSACAPSSRARLRPGAGRDRSRLGAAGSARARRAAPPCDASRTRLHLSTPVCPRIASQRPRAKRRRVRHRRRRVVDAGSVASVLPIALGCNFSTREEPSIAIEIGTPQGTEQLREFLLFHDTVYEQKGARWTAFLPLQLPILEGQSPFTRGATISPCWARENGTVIARVLAVVDERYRTHWNDPTLGHLVMFEALPGTRVAVRQLMDAACEWLAGHHTRAARAGFGMLEVRCGEPP